jgi:hypothetical protein
MASRPYDLSAIPSQLAILLPDLDCLTEAGQLDYGLLKHLEEHALWELPQAGTPAWVEQAIQAQPGIWAARLCRAMHDLPETREGIAFCGACHQLANPRKRAGTPPGS